MGFQDWNCPFAVTCWAVFECFGLQLFRFFGDIILCSCQFMKNSRIAATPKFNESKAAVYGCTRGEESVESLEGLGIPV